MSRTRRWLIAAAVVFAVSPAAASAAPSVTGTFDTSGIPGHLAPGPDGNVWFTITNSTATTPKQLGRIKPDGTVDEFELPGAPSAAAGIVTGPDNKLWISEPQHVIRADVGNPAGGDVIDADIVDARTIAVGPDGNLWTASADKVFRITTAVPPVVTPFTVSGMGARGIAAGSDGNIWVVDFAGDQIIRMTTAGVFSDATKFPLGAGAGPQEIATGPAGQLGFGAPNAQPDPIFGRMALNGTFQPTPMGPGADPSGIVLANDSAYWFGMFGQNKVGRITPDTGAFSSLPLDAGSGPRHIAKGAGNTLWVGLETSHKIARVSGVTPPSTQGPGGGGNDPPPDVTAPGVTTFAFGSDRIRTFTGPGASIARVKRGATVTYTLTEAGVANFTVQRLRTGRKVRAKVKKVTKTKCVKPTRKNRKRKKCTRVSTTGSFTRQSGVGVNSFTFTGRVKNKPLRAGSYRMVLVVKDAAGNVSTPRRARFKVVK